MLFLHLLIVGCNRTRHPVRQQNQETLLRGSSQCSILSSFFIDSGVTDC